MSSPDGITTYADYRAYCRDTNQDEDEPTARELASRSHLRYLQALDARDDATQKRLWQAAERMIEMLDSGLMLVILSMPFVAMARLGWLAGCAYLGGDPTLSTTVP